MGMYPTYQDMVDYTADMAVDAGLDPTEVVKGWKGEGLAPGVWQSNVVKNGVREPSYGIPQLHSKYLGADFERDTGLQLSDPNNWKEVTKYGISRLKDTGWSPYYGARKVGLTGAVTPFDPARPFDPSKVPGYDTASAGAQQPMLLAPPDPTDQPQGGILDPNQVAGLPQAAPAAPQGGLMNFIQSPGALGLASGLLMAGGSSPRRIGLGEAFGSGLSEMGKAQALAAANEMKREQLASQATSDQQTRVMNMLTMQQMMENQAQKKLEAKQAQAGLESDLDTAYSSADGGYKAAEFLSKDPLGEQIAVTPEDKVLVMRYAIANAKSKNPQTDTWFQNMFGTGSEFVMKQYGLDISTPEGLKHADELVGAVETLNKQRSNLVNQLTAMSQGGQRSATALLNRLTGTGAHAGLAVNMAMMSGLRDKVLSQADASGFHIGPHAPDESGQDQPSQTSSQTTAAPDLTTVPPPTSTAPPPVTATTPPNAPAPITPPSQQAGAATKPQTPKAPPPPFATKELAQAWAQKQPPGNYFVVIGGVMYPITVSK